MAARESLDDLIIRALDEEDQLVSINATRALFSIVIEQLGDLFEPALCDVYAQLFAHVISRALPEYNADELLLRYRRVRQVRRFRGGEVRRVFVLSRVTLGADVAVTSVALAAAKERFPGCGDLLRRPGEECRNVRRRSAHLSHSRLLWPRQRCCANVCWRRPNCACR